MCSMLIVGIEAHEVSMPALHPQTLTKRGARVEDSAVFTLWMPGTYGFLFLETFLGFSLSSNLKNWLFFNLRFLWYFSSSPGDAQAPC